jgi:hypothetical protein
MTNLKDSQSMITPPVARKPFPEPTYNQVKEYQEREGGKR